MYNFEKVTRRADRLERTREPSRDRRSKEKISKTGLSELFRCPDILLTPKAPGDTVRLCVRMDLLAYLRAHILYLSVVHEEEKHNEAEVNGAKN